MHCQGLIQKEKVDIDCEKDAQTSILVTKIATQWWANVIKEPKLYITFIFYYTFLLPFDQKTGFGSNGSFNYT